MGSWSNFSPSIFCLWIVCLLFSLFHIQATASPLTSTLYLHCEGWLSCLMLLETVKAVTVIAVFSYFPLSFILSQPLQSLSFLGQKVLFFSLTVTWGLKTDILGWCCPLSSVCKQSTIAGGTQNPVIPPRKASAERAESKVRKLQKLKMNPSSMTTQMINCLERSLQCES